MQTKYKEIILGAAVVLLGVLCWWFLRSVFYGGALTVGCWVWGIILFIFFGIALCLAMLLIKNKIIFLSSSGLTSLSFLGFFNNEPIYYLAALLILFFASVLASKRIKKEEEVQVSLDFFRIFKRGLPIFITAFILVISLAYYFSPALMNRTESKIKIPEKLIDAILNPLKGLIQEKLPEGIDLDSDANKMLPETQQKDLEVKFGIKIDKGDTGRKILYKIIDYQINNFTGAYQYLIPLGLAIGLFITLKLISIIYVVVVIMLSWLTLRILVAFKFAKFEKIQKEVETVSL